MARSAVEVLHVGSACRDLTPDDPRGWRLGGGVTYAALTTARLGLRTAAVIGTDGPGGEADELDLLRDAGVDLLLVPLAEAPVFENRETPAGRSQTCHAVGVPIEPPTLPASWLAARAWSLVPVAGEIGEAWASGHPRDGVRRGRLAGDAARPGRRGPGRPPRAEPVGAPPPGGPGRRESPRRRTRRHRWRRSPPSSIRARTSS